ncbi:MAG: hypothetical protein K6F98_07315 [Bacteroidales bacterium]|nr:hypothetical protein [Bacteroidales bacterium]
MNEIGIIASVIAAIAAIIALIFTIRNSKGNVNKRIERKQAQIHALEQRFFQTYGPMGEMRQHYEIQMQKEKLEKEIQELKKRI